MIQLGRRGHDAWVSSETRTLDPRGDVLQGVDHLRVEARRQLDAHAGREEHEVQIEQVRFPEEPLLVFVCKARDNGVGFADLGACARCDGHRVFVK